jgi:hypothetical protein
MILRIIIRIKDVPAMMKVLGMALSRNFQASI